MSAHSFVCLWSTGLHNPPNATAYQRALFYSKRWNAVFLYPSYAGVGADLETSISVVRVGKRIALGQRISYAIAAYRWVRLRKPSVIVTLADFTALLGFVLSRTSPTKWIVDLWDHPLLAAYNNLRRLRVGRFIIHLVVGNVAMFLARQADAVICGIHPEALGTTLACRCVAVTNGVLFEELQRIRSSQTEGEATVADLVYVGVISRHRGLPLMLELTKRLAEEGKPATLLLVGPASDEDARWLQQQVARDHLSRLVSWLGAVEWHRAMEIVARCGICLFPFPDTRELRYIYPLKVLEYMALGKPVVSSDLPGVRTYIADGENGFLLSPREASSWATVVTNIRSDPSIRARLTQAALDASRMYSWTRIHEGLDAKLKEIL